MLINHVEFMVTTEEAKDIRRNHSKFIKQKSKEKQVLMGKAQRFYKNAIIAGKSEEAARAECLDRLGSLGLTERKLDNYLAPSANPKADALTEAKVLVWMENLQQDVDTIRDQCDKAIVEIQGKRDAGEEWYEMEEVEMVGGKNTGTRTKKIPILEAQIQFAQKKADALDRFFTAVKNVKGNQVLINIDNRKVDEGTLADLDYRIKMEEAKLLVKNGVPVEEAVEVQEA